MSNDYEKTSPQTESEDKAQNYLDMDDRSKSY